MGINLKADTGHAESAPPQDKYDDEPVANGEEELEESVSEDEEIDGDDSDKDAEEEKSGDDENDSDQDKEQINELNKLTKLLDFVICKITGSARWRQKFKAIALAKALGLLD
ncbi:hypothetical protein H4Q26_013697 [Puccinia striiformis f. sp. tritici PST-130]|nr:hypothetical protein H4Q26_013697 [Puccinia striiformis f. sp. tritici PST-130]